MDPLESALAGQYRATLAMLKDCVEKCPNDIWEAGNHPRNTWRIAVHAAFFAHLYLMQKEEDFQQFKNFEDKDGLIDLYTDANAPVIPSVSQAQVLEYIDHIDTLIEPTLASMDLSSPDSGFSWYKDFPKLDHIILSIRHLGIHVGQLEKILDLNNINYKWVSRIKSE